MLSKSKQRNTSKRHSIACPKKAANICNDKLIALLINGSVNRW